MQDVRHWVDVGQLANYIERIESKFLVQRLVSDRFRRGDEISRINAYQERIRSASHQNREDVRQLFIVLNRATFDDRF